MADPAAIYLRKFSLHQFFHWFAVGTIIPVTTLFLISRGLDLFQVGLCLAVYSGMVFLFELPTGGLADQIGRKTVYLISSAISITSLVILLLPIGTTLLVFIGFGMMGIARSLSTGTIDAWFVDNFNAVNPGGNLQKAFARVGFWIPFGLGLGTLLGGVLPMLSEYLHCGRYTFNLATMLLVHFWNAIYTKIWINEKIDLKGKGVLSSFQNLPLVLKDAFEFGLRNKALFLLLLATLFWGFSIISIENLWQPRVKGILGSEEQSWIFGLLATGYFIASSVGSLLVTFICRLLRDRYVIVLVLFRLTMGASFWLLSLQIGILGFALFYFLLFLQNGMLSSPHQSLFHELVPDEKRSTLISLESLFMSVGAMVGSALLGWQAETYSIAITWITAGIIFSASSLLYLVFSGIKNRSC